MSTSLDTETEVVAPSPTQALELSAAYRKRWPVQENVFKDWLIPLGLDINHGYAKTEVENSEVAKKRQQLEQGIAMAAQRVWFTSVATLAIRLPS